MEREPRSPKPKGKHLSKFTQNYPTERKDYPGEEKGKQPAEGDDSTIDEALLNSQKALGRPLGKKPKAA